MITQLLKFTLLKYYSIIIVRIICESFVNMETLDNTQNIYSYHYVVTVLPLQYVALPLPQLVAVIVIITSYHKISQYLEVLP